MCRLTKLLISNSVNEEGMDDNELDHNTIVRVESQV